MNVSDTRCAWRRPAWGRRSTRFALLSRLSHAVSVAVGLLIYVMAARIGRQRRHPSAAMGCVLAIVAFSYAAVPLFLMFGSRKFVRPLQRCRPHAGGRTGIAGCRPAAASFAGTVTPAWVHLGYAAAGGAGAGATGAQCAHRLPGAGREGAGGPAGHGGLAQHSLDVCTFVFGDDELGRRLDAALQRAWTTRRSTAWMRSAGRGPSCYSARSKSDRHHIASPRKIALIAKTLSNWHSGALCRCLTLRYKSTAYGASCVPGEYKTQ
ncbi:hypothetical protein [Paracidovorax citrulli]|uniref:hypothetical protein n=1 Tax=Paracidovorax citrulli TaxID=80869 RepID=UPI003FA7025F